MLLKSSFSLAIAMFVHYSQPSPFSNPTLSGNYSLTIIDDISGPHNLENIAVRHTGDLLVTSTTSSSLFQVSPDRSEGHVLIAEIPFSNALTGIAELEKDIFYVVSLNLSGATPVPGSNAVWEIDMRKVCTAKNGTVSGAATVKLVTKLPDAQLLNGLCRLSPRDNLNLLISDSVAGSVLRLDVHTEQFKTVIQDDAMAITPTGLAIGINGIHTYDRALYFVNLNKEIFARVPISLSTGAQTGPVEVIVNGTAGDDFALSKDGKRAWIAMNSFYTLVEVDIPRKQASVIANSTLLMSDSSVAFGRTLYDRNSLYVTAAAPSKATNGSTEGRVVRVDLPITHTSLSL